MSTTGYLDGILQQLLNAKKSQYSEDSMAFYLQEEKYIIEDIPQVKNLWQERLKCTLVRHRSKSKVSSLRCIIYLHGMGSTRLQSLSLVQCLPSNYCLCMFDMSGSGKSQGQFTTYGIKECQDIQAVITHLHAKMGLNQFILWGRSMGAVAALMHVLQNANKSQIKLNQEDYVRQHHSVFSKNRQDMIKAIVLDSPFHNFRDVVREKAVKNFSVPSFLADTVVGYIESAFSRILANKIGEKYNPFHINFNKQINLNMPIIMVYSQKDEVVSFWHSQRIIKNIKSKFQKVLINQCNHNEPRPDHIITSIFQKLEKYNRLKEYESKRFNTHKSAATYSCEKKRGIFVFTPSKQKQHKKSTQFIHTERRFLQPHLSSNSSTFQCHSLRQSPKSTVMTPRKTKISLQSSQTFTRNIKQPQEKQSQIATIDTQTNNLISKKLVGVPECDGKSKMMRSMRFNMQKRKQVKIGRQRYLE